MSARTSARTGDPLFMGLQNASDTSRESTPSLPSTDEQTRAFLAAQTQTSTPYILSVWRATALVGSFLLERLQSPQYIVGGGLAAPDPARKSCVRLEVSAEELSLQELNYRADCSRERSMGHGEGGCIPMVLGAFAAVLQLEDEGLAALDALTLTDDSHLPELHYPGTTRAVRLTGRVSLADYSVVMHGATWYARHLGVAPVAADAELVDEAVTALDAAATAALPAADFAEVWDVCFERRVRRDPFYGPDRARLHERASALHAQADTWRAWLQALRAELGVAFLAIAWPAVMARMLGGPTQPGIQQVIPTAVWTVDTAALMRRLDAAGLRITLARTDDVQQSLAMSGGGGRLGRLGRDMRRALSVWRHHARATRPTPRPTPRLCPWGP